MGRKPLKRLKIGERQDEVKNLRKNGHCECKLCGKIFKTPYLCARHEVIHEPKTNIYICECCGFRYTNKYSLINHLKPRQSKKFSCSVCRIGFCEDRLLFNHIRRTHFNLEGKQTSHSSKMVNETWVERVLKTEVYVEVTKLTPNAVVIRKYVKNDALSNDNKKAKDNKSESSKRNITKFKYEAKSVLTDKQIKDRVGSDKDKSKLSPLPEYGNYSQAKCDYCGKNMLKKSLVNHIRERHLKLRRFFCNKCKRSFSRRYQMFQHCCNISRMEEIVS